MSKTDSKASLNQLKSEVLQECQALITNAISMVENASKIRERTMFSTIESLQGQIALMTKEFNLKIGSLKGHETRRERPQNDQVLAEFDNMDEFQQWFDAQKVRYEPKQREDQEERDLLH